MMRSAFALQTTSLSVAICAGAARPCHADEYPGISGPAFQIALRVSKPSWFRHHLQPFCRDSPAVSPSRNQKDWLAPCPRAPATGAIGRARICPRFLSPLRWRWAHPATSTPWWIRAPAVRPAERFNGLLLFSAAMSPCSSAMDRSGKSGDSS
jgi:hypothetical protein